MKGNGTKYNLYSYAVTIVMKTFIREALEIYIKRDKQYRNSCEALAEQYTKMKNGGKSFYDKFKLTILRVIM